MTEQGTRDDKLAELHEQIAAGVAALADSDQWAAMLATAARFPRYSLNNLLLIAAQAPGATRVCGFRAWQQLGRQVRKGEKGIRILAPVTYRTAAPGGDPTTAAGATPASSTEADGAGTGPRQLVGFRVAHVFDIAQTDGAPLPQGPAVTPAAGDAPDGLWAGLADQVAGHGYTVERGDCGQALGWTDGATRSVRVGAGLDDAQAATTLTHELAHIQCGHVGDTTRTRARQEIEAESVACIVTGAAGMVVDPYAIHYVTGWAGGDADKVRAAATAVLTAARTILDALAPSLAPETTQA